jgi:hypothetical protein
MVVLSSPLPRVARNHEGLRDALARARSVYWVPAEPVVDDVLVPALQNTSHFEHMAGFFGQDGDSPTF